MQQPIAPSWNPTPAGERLATAWNTGERLTALPEQERPASLEQGYAAQAVMVERIGEGHCGWKIAGASPRGLRGELPAAPVTGCLIPSRVIPSGSSLQLPVGTAMTLEAEIAFRFVREISPADEALDIGTMIAGAHVAMEVVYSRFHDRKAVGQASFVADNVGFHALVLGDIVPFAQGMLYDEDAGIWRDGERVAQSLSGDDRTQPFLSLSFLWKQLALQRQTIPEGAVVTTGTLCVPVDTARTGVYEARVGTAAVSLTLAG
ncbi:hypothetical protein [Cupriavidus sp. AU9028]|uniref:hypothetical protein n=1 Tax=Cupriavidus sp. AU9028 TaxID=2871157 RepID=UPI001C9869FC|nr:hypothetical protein [Cupriavidus sp. AU9028]MBY4898481.1 hypothetical protein [Cupriavidus sp. AU9028]